MGIMALYQFRIIITIIIFNFLIALGNINPEG